MTRALGFRFPLQPKLIPAEKVARRLGLPPARFRELLPQLVKAGFPAADPIVGNYSMQAVDAWIDTRAGLTNANDPVSAQAAMLQAVRERAWAK